jgi:hypothetical protein
MLYLLYDNLSAVGDGDIMAATVAESAEEAQEIFLKARKTDKNSLEAENHVVEKADFDLVQK